MLSTYEAILMIVVISVVTAALRFLPFAIFPAGKTMPKIMEYLGKVLPGAIMGMLVVYCYRNTSVFSWPFGLPEIIAAAVVIISYVCKKNTLISIASGTVLYMFLIQVVFV